MYNEPDFANVDPILVAQAKNSDVEIIFLLKFHCKLNQLSCAGDMRNDCIGSNQGLLKRQTSNNMLLSAWTPSHSSQLDGMYACS